MKRRHLIQAFNNYMLAKAEHDEKERLEYEIKQLVLSIYDFEIVDDLKGRYEDEREIVRKPEHDYMMSDEDTRKYFQELHKRYIKHDTTIKPGEWFVADEHKNLVEAEEALLYTAHEFFKGSPIYQITDQDFEHMLENYKVREKILDNILRLDLAEKEVQQ